MDSDKCSETDTIRVRATINLEILELQWRQAPPCSSWDTARVAQLLFSPGGICLNLDLGNHDTKAVFLYLYLPLVLNILTKSWVIMTQKKVIL